MTTTKSGPVWLQAFTNKRMAVTLLLMFASSFPLPLTSSGTFFQVWLKRHDVDIKTIAVLSLVGLPYNLKFLWAPLLDRYVPPFLNRRTGWIFLTQLLLIVTIGTMGFFNPAKDMSIIVWLAGAIAFFSASADIVIDAYRVDLLRPDERGAGAAMVQFGSRVAYLGSGAIGLALADVMAWQYVFLLMAACMLVGLITSVWAPAPERPPSPPKSLKDAVIDPFIDYFKRSGSIQILLFVIFYKLADTFAGALLSPFLVDAGFTNTDIAAVSKGVGMVSVILGSFIAGGFVAKWGVYKSLWIFGILQAVSNLVFVGLAYQLLPKPLAVPKIEINGVKMDVLGHKQKRKVDKDEKILKMTVYTFDKDEVGESSCYGECVKTWIPVVLPPTDDKSMVNEKFGTIERTDTKELQLTFQGKPLYTFLGDEKELDAKGDNVDGAWHVVQYTKPYAWMSSAIVVENFCGGMGTVAFLAFLFGLCDRRFSATQYALLTSLMALARTVLSSGTGHMVDYFGWPKFFWVTVLFAIPGLFLLMRIRRYYQEPSSEPDVQAT